MCTHSYLSGDAKENIINQLRGVTDREFLDMNSGKNARVLQHWAGKDEFFFCHWEAERAQDIFDWFEEIGLKDYMSIELHEQWRFHSYYDQSDKELVYKDY